MTFFDLLIEKTHRDFETRHQVRESALKQTRLLTRKSADAIRAIHRGDKKAAEENMQAGRQIVADLKHSVEPYPEIFYSGYTQDALKEYVEARLTINMIGHESLPFPEDLGVEYSTYIRGFAEAIGELRRRCLDILRQGYSEEAECLLSFMDDIYALLVTLDYPDAITNGLRRQTDLVRGIIERTRADLTISFREERLQQSLKKFEERFYNHDKE